MKFVINEANSLHNYEIKDNIESLKHFFLNPLL